MDFFAVCANGLQKTANYYPIIMNKIQFDVDSTTAKGICEITPKGVEQSVFLSELMRELSGFAPAGKVTIEVDLDDETHRNVALLSEMHGMTKAEYCASILAAHIAAETSAAPLDALELLASVMEIPA